MAESDLTSRIAACERRFSLNVEAPFAMLTYNWVAPATTSDGLRVVLKLGTPNPELASEISALSAWAGRGAAQLIAADAADGVLVIERLLPGTPLAELGVERDDEATAIAIALMHELHRTEPPSDLPTLATWTEGLVSARVAGFALELVERALAVRAELLASAPEPVLLHGDLHHTNILAAERQPWLAIDPKGVVGDPAYEPAPFLYNPIDRLLDGATVARRIAHFAEHFERRRVMDWAFVQAVLSAWWSFEETGRGYERALEFARLLQLLR